MIGDPPVLFGDQFHVSWPEAGLVGVETVGAAGAIASVPVEMVKLEIVSGPPKTQN